MALTMDAAALNRFLASDFPQLPEGLIIDSATPGLLIARLRIGEQHLRPGGTVSGPTMFALADVAAYAAILSQIGPVALAVTTNASIDFMRKPAAGRDLLAECRLLKLGRVLAVADTLIHSDGMPDPVARCSLTYSIPPKRG
ncbi:MAG: PaaI family thioesterase [Paracoccus sp. (in: a-proteobacteria)]|nr:PaaI family thioesterase [Paracoccus sp. (in: a-proteobacteria)]